MCSSVQGMFSGEIVFNVRREVWSRKDILGSLRELFSGNSQLHSIERNVRDGTLIPAGFTLVGRGSSCGRADVCVHFRRVRSNFLLGS